MLSVRVTGRLNRVSFVSVGSRCPACIDRPSCPSGVRGRSLTLASSSSVVRRRRPAVVVHHATAELRGAAFKDAHRSGAVAYPLRHGAHEGVQVGAGAHRVLPRQLAGRSTLLPRQGQSVQGEEVVYHPLSQTVLCRRRPLWAARWGTAN